MAHEGFAQVNFHGDVTAERLLGLQQFAALKFEDALGRFVERVSRHAFQREGTKTSVRVSARYDVLFRRLTQAGQIGSECIQ